jgi:hypothetical protein
MFDFECKWFHQAPGWVVVRGRDISTSQARVRNRHVGWDGYDKQITSRAGARPSACVTPIFEGVVAGVAMAALAPSLWSRRLHDADADALRYRLLAAQLRPRQSQIRALRERVLAALSDEAAALDALEAAAERQQEQQQHALKYGQYLNVLSLSARGRRKRRQH